MHRRNYFVTVLVFCIFVACVSLLQSCCSWVCSAFLWWLSSCTAGSPEVAQQGHLWLCRGALVAVEHRALCVPNAGVGAVDAPPEHGLGTALLLSLCSLFIQRGENSVEQGGKCSVVSRYRECSCLLAYIRL